MNSILNPSDAHLLIACLFFTWPGSVNGPGVAPTVCEILSRRASDVTLGAELTLAMSDFYQRTHAAENAFEHAYGLAGYQPGTYSFPPPTAFTKSLGTQVVHLRSLLSDPRWTLPISACQALSACAVPFTADDLLACLDLCPTRLIANGAWALGELLSGSFHGPKPKASKVRLAAKQFIHDRLASLIADDGPQGVTQAVLLHDMGLASKDDLSALMLSASYSGSADAIESLARCGARWPDHDVATRSAVDMGLGKLLRLDKTGVTALDFLTRLPRVFALGHSDRTLAPSYMAYETSPPQSPYDQLSSRAIMWRGSKLQTDAMALGHALTQAGFPLDACGGQPLLNAACMAERFVASNDSPFEFFESILALGADPKIAGPRLFQAPLSWCLETSYASKRWAPWIERLAQLGLAPKDIPDSLLLREHALAYAISLSVYGYAELLLDEGCPPEWIDPVTGETLPTLLAARSHKRACALMARILSAPAARALVDQCPTTPRSLSPLMQACFSLNAEMVQILLAAGASPNLQDRDGNTALHHAGRKYGAKAQEKTRAIVELLLAAGVDPGMTNALGLTASQAMAAKAPLGALEVLLSRRPEDLDGSNPQGKSAQLLLSKRGSLALSLAERAVMGTIESTIVASKPRRI